MLRLLPLRVGRGHVCLPPTLLPSPSHCSVTMHFALCLAGRGQQSLPLAQGLRPTVQLQKFIAKDSIETLNKCDDKTLQ